MRHINKLFEKYQVEVKGSNDKTLENYSDIDIDIYGIKKLPYYELFFIGNKLILVNIYFYKSKKDKHKEDQYNQKQKIKRECQLAIDFMFKYLRSKNKKHLESIQRRI